MAKRLLTCTGLALTLALGSAPIAASAHESLRHDHARNPAFTMAVFGDSPYGTSPSDTAQFQQTPAFIDSINADPDVSSLLQVGDIHSGKQYCTRAYDQSIFDLWTRFADPLVYTPGDNEWADCHKAKEGGGTYNPVTGQIDYVTDPATGRPIDYAGGDPVANLDLVRSVFFSRAGRTLGGPMRVLSQAQVPNRKHQTDRQYVENVIWERHGVLFVTINVPGGSNNDADPWYGTPNASPSQVDEAANRTAADVRWLDIAFALARFSRARGVVIGTQADMWDLDGKQVSHLTNYEPILASVASHTLAFQRPVLMFNGDSHVYRSDNPLAPAAPCTGDDGVCSYDDWASHPNYDVPNFHRVVVHGSTDPLEWLKVTVDRSVDAPASSDAFGPFRWQRMPLA